MFISGWTADYPDPDSFLSLFTSSSGSNLVQFHNKTFDLLVQQAGVARTTVERVRLYRAAQELLLMEEPAIVPLYLHRMAFLTSNRVKKIPVTRMSDLYIKYVELMP